MATAPPPPNVPKSPAAGEPVAGVWIVSRAKRFVLRDGDDILDPVREMRPGKAQWFFNHEPGRFTFDPDVVELPNKAPPAGAELAALRKADADQRKAKLDADARLADELPRRRAPKDGLTPVQRLAERRQAEAGGDAGDKPRDPASSV